MIVPFDCRHFSARAFFEIGRFSRDNILAMEQKSTGEIETGPRERENKAQQLPSERSYVYLFEHRFRIVFTF